jgi:hypothetical protein
MHKNSLKKEAAYGIDSLKQSDRHSRPKSKTTRRLPWKDYTILLYWVGHSQEDNFLLCNYCVKKVDGTIVQQGKIAAERKVLLKWMEGLPGPWLGAMEATIFTG